MPRFCALLFAYSFYTVLCVFVVVLCEEGYGQKDTHSTHKSIKTKSALGIVSIVEIWILWLLLMDRVHVKGWK